MERSKKIILALVLDCAIIGLIFAILFIFEPTGAEYVVEDYVPFFQKLLAFLVTFRGGSTIYLLIAFFIDFDFILFLWLVAPLIGLILTIMLLVKSIKSLVFACKNFKNPNDFDVSNKKKVFMPAPILMFFTFLVTFIGVLVFDFVLLEKVSSFTWIVIVITFILFILYTSLNKNIMKQIKALDDNSKEVVPEE